MYIYIYIYIACVYVHISISGPEKRVSERIVCFYLYHYLLFSDCCYHYLLFLSLVSLFVLLLLLLLFPRRLTVGVAMGLQRHINGVVSKNKRNMIILVLEGQNRPQTYSEYRACTFWFCIRNAEFRILVLEG